MDKNKKQLNKKTIFTAAGITVLCAALLAGAYVLQKTPETAFEPASTETNTATDTWDENAADATEIPKEDTTDTTQVQGDPTDQTQTIVQEDESGTTTNLSDSKTKAEATADKPQEKPVTTDDTTNPDKQPEYDSQTPAPTDTPDSAPAPSDSGSSDTAGKVYDPVFGWIDSGTTQQDTVDSDGDINKQIGTMGGN